MFHQGFTFNLPELILFPVYSLSNVAPCSLEGDVLIAEFTVLCSHVDFSCCCSLLIEDILSMTSVILASYFNSFKIISLFYGPLFK